MMHSLCFQSAEKTLRHSIIPTIALATHAADNSIALQHPLKIMAAILAATIRWKTSPGSGRRRQLPYAGRPSPVSGQYGCCIDQPTTCRENRSMITARYNQPPPVHMDVISEHQTRLDSFTTNCRSSRLGATGKLCLLSVVALYFFFCLADTPAKFIKVPALLRPHVSPWDSSSSAMRRAPYVPLDCR